MKHAEMIREYTKCMKNILSSSAEKRMRELDEIAALEGLQFKMVNEKQWMMPHFIGDPVFELVER